MWWIIIIALFLVWKIFNIVFLTKLAFTNIYINHHIFITKSDYKDSWLSNISIKSQF